jgi:hypothetical protein
MVLYHFKTSEGSGLGPIDINEFRQRHEAGEITDETLVWRSGLADWMTYGALRAIEQRAAQPRPTEPPPLPAKVARRTAAPSSADFMPCGVCGQEWPGSLLFLEHGRKICGPCQHGQKENLKKRRLKKGAGNGIGAWALMILAIVCAGCLAYKVSRYGIRLPKGPVQELTAPATYGK